MLAVFGAWDVKPSASFTLSPPDDILNSFRIFFGQWYHCSLKDIDVVMLDMLLWISVTSDIKDGYLRYRSYRYPDDGDWRRGQDIPLGRGEF
eukprot:1355137-Amorphochlora_amoeboformis.AAC.1